MARLYKREGSPLYYARWTDAKGVNHRESTGTADRRLATDFLSARVGEAVHRRAGIATAAVIRLVDAFGEYLEEHRPPMWSQGWWDRCYWLASNRIIPDLGGPDAAVGGVTRAHAESARARWTGQVSPPTVNRICAVASSFFGWATNPAREYALKNPFAGIRRFQEHRITPPEITEMSIALFLATLKPADTARAATLAIDTGLRVSEVSRLRPGDLRGDVLHVVSNYTRGMTKNKRERWVPMTARAKQAFLAQLEARGATLFSGMTRAYWYHLKRALDDSGLPQFRWHDLRHYALSRMAAAGMAGPTLKDVAGWTTLAMADRYLHPSTRAAAEVIARMSECAETVPQNPPREENNRTQMQDPPEKT